MRHETFEGTTTVKLSVSNRFASVLVEVCFNDCTNRRFRRVHKSVGRGGIAKTVTLRNLSFDFFFPFTPAITAYYYQRL
jgi:hypothetical protein